MLSSVIVSMLSVIQFKGSVINRSVCASLSVRTFNIKTHRVSKFERIIFERILAKQGYMGLKGFIVVYLLLAFFCDTISACHCNANKVKRITPENRLSQAQQLMRQSESVCKALGFEQYGRYLLDENELDSVEYYLQKAEYLFKKESCSDSLLINTYTLWAQLYYTKADYKKALEFTLKLLPCAEASGDLFEVAMCNTMIAQLFNQTKQAQAGLIYSQRASALVSKIKDSRDQMELLCIIAKRLLWHFQDTKHQPSLDSSEYFSRHHLMLAKQLNNSRYISRAYNNLEAVAYERGDFQSSLKLLDSAKLFLDSNQFADRAVIYFDKADILIEMNDLKQAKIMADSVESIYRRLANPVYIAEALQLKERIAALLLNYRDAYQYQKEALHILDSVKNLDQITEVTKLERKYNQAKNEHTIASLAFQKRIYFSLALIAVLIALVIAFFLRQQKLQLKKKILETEQRLNRARMNPHFFFNALSTLQKFAMRDNDGQAIASNISKFSHIMRETLESTYKEYVTIEQEIDFLNEYMEVQKIRFPKTFSYTIKADSELDIDEILIPAMIIQPFIENSIEHGFLGIDYAGHLSVHFSIQSKELQIVIEDNGRGMPLNVTQDQNKHISRASQIIKDRIYLLNIKLKTKAGFSIDNNPNGPGVVVKIHLPLLYINENV